MWRIPDATLRRQYRGRLWNAVKHRPNIRLLRFYCLACAMHFHFDRLIGLMEADQAAAKPASPAAEAAGLAAE